MLDKIGVKLLNLINSTCEGTGYVVLSSEELLDATDNSVDRRGLSTYLSELKSKELISVRYEDEREVCLCLLPKGRLIYQTISEGISRGKRAEKNTFRYSFLGGVSGGVIGGAIGFILSVIMGAR